MPFNIWTEANKLDAEDPLGISDPLYLRSALDWHQEIAEQSKTSYRGGIPSGDNIQQIIKLFKKGVNNPRKAASVISSNIVSRTRLRVTKEIKSVKKARPNFGQLVLPNSDEPIVSVIIPVYNLLPVTLNCLHSIQRAKEPIAFEVIVVDDNSPQEEVRTELSKVPGLKFISRKTNGGFVMACNTGARHAKGKFIYFLNNDTEVDDYWLSESVKVFDDPSVGAVGSKLVYPDGRLQEAGGIIFNDGSAWNFGNSQDPNNPQYNYLREVDYSSGAGLMVLRDAFNKIGGFDQDLAPGYYEDTELAFALREHGYRVMYQPKSVVTHFEGATSVAQGISLKKSMKAYQIINLEKFKKKRAEELKKHFPRDPKIVGVAARHKRGKRIWVSDFFIPRYDREYGAARMLEILKVLAKDHTITFIARDKQDFPRYRQTLEALGIEVITKHSPQQLEERFLTDGKYFDYFLCSRPEVIHHFYYLYKKYCRDIPLIFDTVDVHHIRMRRQKELESDPELISTLSRQEKYFLSLERGYGQLADVIWAVTPADKKYLAELLPNKKIDIVSAAHEVRKFIPSLTDRKNFFFIGSFDHPPNAAAINHFVKNILPLVHKQIPGAVFNIFGEQPPSAVRKLSGFKVKFLGAVDNLNPVYDGHRLFVCPLTFGSGLKGKIIMAMSNGLPVVSSTIGVEGMSVQDGENVIVADSPPEFADAVVKLYQDDTLWEKISRGGQAFVAQHYGHKQFSESITKSLSSTEIVAKNPTTVHT